MLVLAPALPGCSHAPRVSRPTATPARTIQAGEMTPRRAPAPPTGGSAQLTCKRLEMKAKRVHLLWTITTDREWSNVQTSPSGLELSVASPPSKSRRYQYDLVIEASPNPRSGEDLRYIYKFIRPEGGKVESGNGTLARGLRRLPLNRSVEVRIDHPRSLLLPAEEALLQVNGREAGGAVFQQEFRLILAP